LSATDSRGGRPQREQCEPTELEPLPVSESVRRPIGQAGYKKPKFVAFRPELPKTNVGKILRRQLRDEELAAKAAPGAA